MNHGERNEKGDAWCAACETWKYPAHAMQENGSLRPCCPKCGGVFPELAVQSSAESAPAAPVESRIAGEVGAHVLPVARRVPGSAPADILSAARDRRIEIDRLLTEHDALIAERDQLDRMIRAAERTGRRRKKKAPALKLAT